ncbi:MAG TPA: hypothetical protein VF411_01890 [Bacteroidia bacterium]
MKATLNEIALSNAQVKLREDGIVQVNMDDNATLNLKDMKEILAAIKKVTKGTPHQVLKVCGTYTMIEDDARQFVTTGESTKYSTAEALVCHSLAQKLIVSFHINKRKTVGIPTRLFTDLNEAENWLQELAKAGKN